MERSLSPPTEEWSPDTTHSDLRETWKSGDYFWIEGATTKFGKPATFKVNLYDVALVESIDGSPSKFRIKTKDGEMKTANAIEFGLYGSMPYSSPRSWRMSDSIELESDGLKVNIPLEDIHSLKFDEGIIILRMRNGENGEVLLDEITRIYGRLKTDEIIFDSISSSEGDKIRLIEFLE